MKGCRRDPWESFLRHILFVGAVEDYADLGTETAIANVNGFAVYTVTLASYDLIPTYKRRSEFGRTSRLRPA